MTEKKPVKKKRKAPPKKEKLDISDVLSEDFMAKAREGSVAKNMKKFQKLLDKSEYEKIIGRAMITNLDEGIAFINKDEVISIVNNTAKSMLNYKRKDDIYSEKYTNYLIFIDEKKNKIPKDKDPIKFAFSKKEPAHLRVTDNIEMVRRDGSSFPVISSTSPVIINKKFKGVVVIFRDASTEKKINEIKSDFISIASHQLRTPVAVSTLESEMLLSGHYGELNKEQRKAVYSILRYNKKMTYLLDVFMSVSKIELDRFQIKPRPIDLRLLLDDIINDLIYKVKKKKITLKKQYDVNIPIVDMDPELSRIIFQNLIANAINYTPNKGRITIGLEKLEESLVFKVSDTGFGIPDKDQVRLFTKLYRSEKAQNLNSEGSGLGLYITKSVIEKAGYKIWFESEENKGTNFFVEIPLNEK
jgi:two-component system, OmpR family, phosphate regulon sensor histidine kinase PhoR